jgi:DNA polymerase III epsilon subunit-like protein
MKYYKDGPISNAKLCFIDLETTGLSTTDARYFHKNHPERYHRIVELGASKVDIATGEVEEFQIYVNPQRAIPEDATWVHGIRDEDVMEACSAIEAIEQFVDFHSDCQMVWGFNSPFDLRFMVHEYILTEVNPPDIAFYDVGRLAGRLGYGRPALAGLRTMLSLEGEENLHRAGPDATATSLCLLELMAKHFPKDATLADVVAKHDEFTPVYSSKRALKTIQNKESEYGPRICVTGKVDGLLRKEIAEQLQAIGYTYIPRVNNAIEFLVVGSDPGSSKLRKAAQIGVEIVSADAFVKWLTAQSTPTN